MTAAVLLAAGATLAAPAVPARAAACASAGAGVTVVVDFSRLGGEVVVRCAPGDPPTGLAALRNAGFAVTGTQRWGLAFVCRIDGRPGPAADRCVNTPPASAFWGYWHAPPRRGWSYSTVAAATFDPEPGSVEGWSFGPGAPPGIAPPAAVDEPAGAPSTSSGSREPSRDATTPAAKTGGGAAGVLGGALLVAAVAAAAIWAARRRSR
jgi:hypothetical protein